MHPPTRCVYRWCPQLTDFPSRTLSREVQEKNQGNIHSLDLHHKILEMLICNSVQVRVRSHTMTGKPKTFRLWQEISLALVIKAVAIFIIWFVWFSVPE